jgi:hypothetical protein
MRTEKGKIFLYVSSEKIDSGRNARCRCDAECIERFDEHLAALWFQK